MLAYGPQFRYGKNESEVRIQLSRKGMELFKKMYVHRPIPLRIENNDYFFECSYNQIIQYFARFGKEAYVVYPQSVRDSLRAFHADAVARYDAGARHFSKIQTSKNS